MDGSNLFGFFQISVTVFPVMDSMTGAPSGGSGRMSTTTQVSVRINYIFDARGASRQISQIITHMLFP